MQNDPSYELPFSDPKNWDEIKFEMFSNQPGKRGFRSTPFSGHEANRLFLGNHQRANFDDATLVSGVDFRQDGRGFALLDIDRDGWRDMAIVSPNEPRFRLVKNMAGKQIDASRAHWLTLSLQGGNTTAEPTSAWSSRDAFGAVVLVKTGDQTRAFAWSAGEGLSSQNAKRIHVGLGENEIVDEVRVVWPSGRVTRRRKMMANQHLHLLEREENEQTE